MKRITILVVIGILLFVVTSVFSHDKVTEDSIYTDYDKKVEAPDRGDFDKEDKGFVKPDYEKK